MNASSSFEKIQICLMKKKNDLVKKEKEKSNLFY